MSAPPASPGDLTALLVRWSGGDTAALKDLLPAVYGELRRIATRELRRERHAAAIEPTSLVHELYFRLVDQRRATWENRAHFFALSAQLMRRILVDHARARHALKRGGSAPAISLSEAGAREAGAPAADILAIDQALQRLAASDPDQVRIIELRFFAGMTVEETAHVLDRSPRTVMREWRLARAWLFRELQGGS